MFYLIIIIKYGKNYSNQIPCIITKESKNEYCSYIENSDSEGLAQFFKNNSIKELKIILSIYKQLVLDGSIVDNYGIDNKIEEYQKKYEKSVF